MSEIIGTKHTDPALDPASPVVPSGIRSSEFWIAAGLIALGVLLQSGFLDQVGAPPWVGTLAGVVLQVGAALGYTVSRGLVKASANKGAAQVAAAKAMPAAVVITGAQPFIPSQDPVP
jgi:hypothetical protein